MPTPSAIHALHLADVVLPPGTPQAGETCPVYGFAIEHPDGLVVVDTGVGAGHAGIDALYNPTRWPLADRFRALSLTPADVRFVVNSHLHFDHIGENGLSPQATFIVQRAEHEVAQASGYTVREWFDIPNARFELLDGEWELLAGVTVVPTPGHTPGHQSVAVQTDKGLVLLACQAAYAPEEFADPLYAHPRGLAMADDPAKYRDSLERLRALSPRRVHFSHDPRVWEPG